MHRLHDDIQDDEIETMHIYMYRQPGRKLRPPDMQYILQIALHVCLLVVSVVALCSVPGDQPVATIQTVIVPARFLPLTYFKATAAIIPTGSKTYPAVAATGILTVYNGSSLTQRLAAGFILTAGNSMEVITDSDVTVGPADPPNYGMATVPAHAAERGQAGNIAAYAVNAVYGADVYIKNLAPFSGGVDQKIVSYATDGDVHAALMSAQNDLMFQQYRHGGLLYTNCHEDNHQAALTLYVRWSCQYITFTSPRGQVLSVRLSGRQVILQVRRGRA